MFLIHLRELFARDLGKLKQELAAYNNEHNIWLTDGAISNSAGTLCLHLVGSLNHFIGHVLGRTEYVRDREAEFSQKNVSRTVLLQQIEATIPVVTATLEKLDPGGLQEELYIPAFNRNASLEFLLLQMVTHLNYHLGQVNYHRRLLDR